MHETLDAPEHSVDPSERKGSHVDNSVRTGRTEDSHDRPTPTNTRSFFHVDGMYSATCEAFLEAVASNLDGVTDAEGSYVTETIRVDHDTEQVSHDELQHALSRLGYTAVLLENAADAAAERRQDDNILEFRYAAGVLFGTFLLLPYVAFIYPVHLAAMVDWEVLQVFAGGLELGGQGTVFLLRFYLALTGVVLFFTGLPVLRGAYISLKMRTPNADLLVAMTALSAYVYGAVAILLGRNDIFFDVTIFVAASVTAAMFYESAVKQRALGRLTDLTLSQVATAARFQDDGSTTEVAVEELAAGDRILVRQGERIPVDGVLAEDSCTVDEAVVTGESLPVPKQAGDDLIGGSIVTDDAAVVEVGEDAMSSIDRITTALWTLQSADHGVQRHADRLSSLIVGLVAGAALLVSSGAVIAGTGVPETILLFLLVVLVGSPWALGLATPLSVATSLTAALERGIVVFDETVFERLRDVDIVVLDKTGTLTTGEMEITEVDAPPDLLEMAAQLERRASHPAATAIATAFSSDSGDTAVPRSDPGDGEDQDGTGGGGRVEKFSSHRTGIEGVVDGRDILIGTLDLFVEQGWDLREDIESRVHEARGFGRLPVVMGRDGTAEGIVIVGDEPRSGWDRTITSLGERGAAIVILTGDDEEAADFFEQHEAVTHVFADVPPEGKTATIRRLEADGRVAMVGDGTNDAPALAAADLGITLGSGTALAADAADIAIADDAIDSVETAFDIAAAARRRVRQNNRLALVYNGLAIATLGVGVFNPLTAAAAVAICGGLVAGNCLRTLVGA